MLCQLLVVCSGSGLLTPPRERCALDSERAGDLLGGLPAILQQAILGALELVHEARPVNAARIQRITRANAQAALVEYAGRLNGALLLLHGPGHLAQEDAPQRVYGLLWLWLQKHCAAAS
jgi:hypothetical protein